MSVIDMVYPVLLLIGVMFTAAMVIAGGYCAIRIVTSRDKDFIDNEPRV